MLRSDDEPIRSASRATYVTKILTKVVPVPPPTAVKTRAAAGHADAVPPPAAGVPDGSARPAPPPRADLPRWRARRPRRQAGVGSPPGSPAAGRSLGHSAPSAPG